MRPVGRVLVICTGNVCRSPYLERRLRQLLVGQDVHVESAGTRALVGADIEPGSVAALEAVGSDTAGFASRQLTPAMLDAADIVVTATQKHRADAVALHPRALRKTFTLGELADLVRDADLAEAAAAPDVSAADHDTPWAAIVAEVARGRRGLHPARTAAESDIPDPYGRGSAAYDLMSTEIEAQLPVVVAALTPPAG
ncbi:low molecular weight phosphatase family protein [Terrabacter sp. 2TAF16]|jgi:protein-tyrosine phosphatase|uniref:arsenate reductase/protein-tyrosine-phosphatase family protein n=1 Tax=Terrabacter sp. 2TAF16 TaxID=3233008 RepID=UPI003F9BDCD7